MNRTVLLSNRFSLISFLLKVVGENGSVWVDSASMKDKDLGPSSTHALHEEEICQIRDLKS